MCVQFSTGHDIALHSITHVSDTGYWANLNESMWRAEIVAQKQQLSTFASVPLAYVRMA